MAPKENNYNNMNMRRYTITLNFFFFKVSIKTVLKHQCFWKREKIYKLITNKNK